MLIPKIIHRVWMSNNNTLPERNSDVGKCFYSQDKLKDYGYEIKTYNASNFDMSTSNYLLQAYALKKWAFVSDYIRLYVLYNEGGIWLDSDVEIFKSFDELLEQHYFCSVEYDIWNKNKYTFNPTFMSNTWWQDWGVVGIEPHNAIIKSMLDYYDSIDFVGADGWIYDKINPTDGIHDTCTINGNYERLLKKLNIKKELVSTSLEQYTDLVNNSANDIIYCLNTKWMTYFYYNPDVNYNEDVICVHRRQGKWLDYTQNIMYLYEYDKDVITNYHNTIDNYTQHF